MDNNDIKENEENKNIKVEENEKTKKDFHPLWIYIVFQLIIPFIIMFAISFIIAIRTGKPGDPLEITSIASIISLFGLSFTFLIMYFSKMKKEIKRLTKKQIIFTLIVFAIEIVLNLILTSTNEQPKCNY